MDMNDWVMLVTALGGIEGIKQLIKWWMSRKTNARIEDAHADVEEFKALREYNEFLQKQLELIAEAAGTSVCGTDRPAP